jgi:hypothetical protein
LRIRSRQTFPNPKISSDVPRRDRNPGLGKCRRLYVPFGHLHGPTAAGCRVSLLAETTVCPDGYLYSSTSRHIDRSHADLADGLRSSLPSSLCAAQFSIDRQCTQRALPVHGGNSTFGIAGDGLT